MRRIPKGWETMRLAEDIARRARLRAIKEKRPVTRMDLEEVMQGWQTEMSKRDRYANLKWPALRTLISEAKRQATQNEQLNLGKAK